MYFFFLVYFAAADKTIRIWNVSDGKQVAMLEGHTAGLSDVAWSSDSKYLCSGSDDTTIKIWDAEKVKCGLQFNSFFLLLVILIFVLVWRSFENIERPHSLRVLCEL